MFDLSRPVCLLFKSGCCNRMRPNVALAYYTQLAIVNSTNLIDVDSFVSICSRAYL